MSTIRYHDENDPDWIRVPWLEKDDMYELGLTKLKIPDHEWAEYMKFVEYAESFHKKLKEWAI